MQLHVLYRISDGSYKKSRLENATKQHCFENFLENFKPENFHIFEDGCDKETELMVNDTLARFNLPAQIHFIQGGSSAQSFNKVLDFALSLPDDDYVYFIEDDYLHLPKSRLILMEGLKRAHYVSIYDHLDKYINGDDGGNPHVDDGGEITRVFITNSCHWKLTNSTTMTFATSVRILKVDEQVWRTFTVGEYPKDFEAFIHLRNSGRTVATSIPGYATHTEVQWLSPFIDWDNL